MSENFIISSPDDDNYLAIYNNANMFLLHTQI